MRVRIAALSLCLGLCLTGCGLLLDRSFLSISPHEPVSAGVGGPSSALRVESYQDLVNAVLYLVSEGVEHGVLALYNYTRDVETDLTAACLEVVQEDPLGAYAVDYIKHDHSLFVSYYEANLYITYRRTPSQVASIASVTGSSAIRQELRETLSSFQSEAVLRVSYFAEDEEYLLTLVRQAYYDAPSTALGMPKVEISLYPETGLQRIVEIRLAWEETAEVLRGKSHALGDAALALLPQQADAEDIYQILAAHAHPSPQGNTAYHALVEQSASSEGYALAYKLLCDQSGVECTVVQGELDGEAYFWNIAARKGGYVHVDVYRSLFGLSDEELAAFGGTWDAAAYPACEPQPEAGSL